jgi:hypothetical protein
MLSTQKYGWMLKKALLPISQKINSKIFYIFLAGKIDKRCYYLGEAR